MFIEHLVTARERAGNLDSKLCNKVPAHSLAVEWEWGGEYTAVNRDQEKEDTWQGENDTG